MPRSEFQYWTGSQWTTATTHRGSNALINFSYQEKMHGAAQIEVTLSNRSSGDALAAGNLDAVLTDFQRVRVIDGTTKLIVFYGRTFDIDKNYDMQYGSTLLVTCRDALFELADIEMTDITNTPLLFGTGQTITKRSGLIAAIVERFANNNISTSDSDKFEASYMPYTKALDSYNLSGGKKSALRGIIEIASADPINGDITGTVVNDSTKYGHDFYVEPRFTNVNSITEEGISDLTYFRRGSRVDPPADLGLTAKYAVRGGVATGNRVKHMLPGYDFDQPQQELFSEINAYFTYDNRRAQARKFELWYVSAPTHEATSWTGALATSDFRAGERIYTKETIASVANNGDDDARFTVTGGHGLPVGGTVTIAGTTNYNATTTITAATATTFDTTQTYVSSQTGTASSPVYGRIHYLSATPYIALVSIFSDPYKANAPKATANVTGLTSTRSFTLSSRASDSWGIRRSGRVEYSGTPDPETVKNQLVGMLTRSQSTQTRGNFTMIGFPHHKEEDATASATGSSVSAFADAGGGEVLVTTGTHNLTTGDSVVISGTTNYNGRFDVTVASSTTFKITDSFVANDATGIASGDKITTTSFNPMAYGFRVGMVVEKLSGTGGTRVAYGYAKAVTATTITVQLNGATATEAWTIGGGDYYRVVIPERPGMQVRVINAAVDIAGDHIITEVAYQEGPGQLIGRLRTAGENDVVGATPTFGSRSAERSKDEGLPTSPPASQISFKYDGDWTAASGGLNVAWSGGKTVGSDSNVSSLILSDGREFNICGDTSASPTTKRPDVVSVLGGALTESVPYVVYFDVDGQTEDDDPGEPDPLETYQFSVALKSTYDAAAESGKLDDILIAYVTRPSDAAITASSDIEAEFVLLQNAGRASMVSAATGLANRTIVPGLLETDFLLAGKIAVRNPSTSGANATNKQRFKFDATAGNGWFRGFSSGSTSDDNNVWFDFDADDQKIVVGVPDSSAGGMEGDGILKFDSTGITAVLGTAIKVRDTAMAGAGWKDGTFYNGGNGSLYIGVNNTSGQTNAGGVNRTVTTLDLTQLDGVGILNAGSVTSDVTGDLTGNADTATTATNVTVTANNTANETVYLTFVDGYEGGTEGIESDTGLYYNPYTGFLRANYLNGGNGTESFPAHTFNLDTDTGMYRYALNQIGFTAGGSDVLGISSSAVWPTAGTGTIDLGVSTRLWEEVFSVNATINTSDLRAKENIQPIKLGLDFINDLNPITYKWKKKSEKKLDATHYGIVAQEVVETLKDYGITSLEDFAGIHNDGEGEAYYGARYTEFIPILMKAIQELSAEVKELKEKI